MTCDEETDKFETNENSSNEAKPSDIEDHEPEFAMIHAEESEKEIEASSVDLPTTMVALILDKRGQIEISGEAEGVEYDKKAVAGKNDASFHESDVSVA